MVNRNEALELAHSLAGRTPESIDGFPVGPDRADEEAIEAAAMIGELVERVAHLEARIAARGFASDQPPPDDAQPMRAAPAGPPRLPTEAMIQAMRAGRKTSNVQRAVIEADWRAMWDAWVGSPDGPGLHQRTAIAGVDMKVT